MIVIILEFQPWRSLGAKVDFGPLASQFELVKLTSVEPCDCIMWQVISHAHNVVYTSSLDMLFSVSSVTEVQKMR